MKPPTTAEPPCGTHPASGPADLAFRQGLALQQGGQFAPALEHYVRALAIDPHHAMTHSCSGDALWCLGRSVEALASYERALALEPGNAALHNNRAFVLRALGRVDEALAGFDHALAIAPGFAEAHNNRGTALQDLQRDDEALASYDRALQLNPDFFDAWGNRAKLLQRARRSLEALAAYDQALRCRPDDAATWNDRGSALSDMARYPQALESYDRALALHPAYALAHRNRAATLHALRRLDEALASYATAMATGPGPGPVPDYMYGAWLYLKMQLCDWDGAADRIAELAVRIEHGERCTEPLPVLALSDSPALHRKAAQTWAAQLPAAAALPPAAPRHDGRLRIGYFSADFHEHATAYLMAELFELHDRERFELIAFSFGPERQDTMRSRLVAAFGRFIDVRAETDRAVAQRSRELGIDIAIDLKGYTQHQRTGIFANRAAPVQVSYLGYPGTMGAACIDYLVADRTLIPIASRQHYSEKIVQLPGSYQVNDRKRAIAPGEPSRAALGLPPAGFVFCCFNNSYKITPDCFAGWMRILHRVDGSVLWLLEDNPTAVANLRREAAVRGVAPERLVFAPRLPLPDHLARLRAADLFLDTSPYNAHTTASDALWVGLPLLTLAGASFASRVGASLLEASGMAELIVPTREDYEALAVALADDPARLQGLKQKLARNRTTTPLFDTPAFACALETAYTRMHERRLAGLPPDHIVIEA